MGYTWCILLPGNYTWTPGRLQTGLGLMHGAGIGVKSGSLEVQPSPAWLSCVTARAANGVRPVLIDKEPRRSLRAWNKLH